MRFILLTARGLEGIACREVKETVPGAAILDQGRGTILLTVDGAWEPLLKLHSIDDLYAEIVMLDDLDPRRHPLALLEKSLRRPPDLAEAVAMRIGSRNLRRSPTFRVMSQMEGHQPFRRSDAQRTVEDSLAHFHPDWELLTTGSPTLQFALWVSGHTCRVGLRLVEAGFARRPWKVGHIPASLPPSIAYGLVRTAGLNADEVFLDPFCGAGTILVERGLLAPPPGTLLGSDLNATARDAATANAAQARVSVSLHDWDATALPLDARSVDTIVTNPPYGQRHGHLAGLPVLYSGFLAEAARVLRPGGRCVVLTAEATLLERIVATQQPTLVREKRFSIDVLGITAQVTILHAET